MVSSASARLDDAGVGNVVDATSPMQRLDNIARLIDRARVSAVPFAGAPHTLVILGLLYTGSSLNPSSVLLADGSFR